MEVAILGPLEVRDGSGAIVGVTGQRLRTLLTRLALEPGRAVGVGTLVHTVWGDAPPADEANALQTLVSRLRRTLGGTGTVGQSPSGYRLALEPDDTDAGRFRRLAADGAAALRRGAAADALARCDEALALWRGPALGDTRDSADDLAAHASELDELRLGTVLDRAEAHLLLDPSGVDAAELERLVTDHPLHERLAGLLIRSLAGTGRGADALQAYEALRSRLADELGVDPSAELQHLHVGLLRADGDERPGRRTNLKAQLTSFVGRDDEVSRIVKSLGDSRLVTLVGPGGAGKTRLASEAANRILDSAPDGVWLSELATVTAGADVPQAVFGALGLREIQLFNDRRAQLTARDATAKLRDTLADRSAVVVLDNCEHVVEAAARLAEFLLSECPELRIVATSREPLGITGEALLAVPPLGQPAPDAEPAAALEYPAVRLFADRAVAVSPDFVVDRSTLPAVGEIVRRLDGLPLAIELAAARLRTLPVDEIARRIGDRFRLLTGGSRTALPRHRTLRAVVEWSWELLGDDERRLVEVLAVFPAGVTVTSAAAVHPDAPSEDAVDDLLASLIDKSLLQPVQGGRRMRMLETIREYGTEQLASRGELADARERHARHFRDVLFEAEPYLTTRDQLPWFELLTAERENIVAALRYYCDVEDADAALGMALALGGYAMMLGAHADIAGWTADAVAVPGGSDPEQRVMARALLALNATAAGERRDPSMTELRNIVEELRDGDFNPKNPMIELMRPVMAFFTDDSELAERWSEEALRSEHPWTRAAARMFRASFAENSGALDIAREDTAIALREFEELGERWGLASVLRNVAQLRTLDGDLDGARQAYEQALAAMRELNSTDDEVYIHAQLANLALRQGDADSARAYLAPARRCDDDDRPPHDMVFRLVVLGDVEYRLGERDAGRAMVADALARLDSLPRENPALGHMRALSHAVAARVAIADERDDDAATHCELARVAAVGTRDMPIVALAGVVIARLMVRDDAARSAYLLGAAAVLRGAEDRTDLDIAALIELLRGGLGEDGFTRHYDEGRALPSEAALALFESGPDEGQDRLR